MANMEIRQRQGEGRRRSTYSTCFAYAIFVASIVVVGSAQAATTSSEGETTCKIPYPKAKRVQPTIVASYPGSGARMSWKLIRAMTGILTGGEGDTSGEVVSMKTHYPSHAMRAVGDRLLTLTDRAILLVRNPVHSIPSFASYLFERQNNIATHVQRAPIEAWIEIRNESFKSELQKWKDHINFWMKTLDDDHRIVVSFEDLTNAKTGPQTLATMGHFLSQADGVRLAVKEEDLPCVWETVLLDKGTRSKAQQSLRTGGPANGETYPFTSAEIEEMEKVFRDLRDKWKPLHGTMSMYLDSLQSVTIAKE